MRSRLTMNKYIVFLLGILFAASLLAEVQELPDIEISGPSLLKSTLEKKGLLHSELNVADVTDSLNPIFPPIVPMTLIAKQQKNHAAYLDISNLGFNSYFLMNNVVKDNGFISGTVNYYTPKSKWNQFNGELGLISNIEKSTLGLLIRNTSNHSPRNIKYQNDSSLKISYQLNDTHSPELPVELKISTDTHLYQDKTTIPNRKSTKYYLNNNFQFNYYFAEHQAFGFDASYIQNAPVIILQLLNTSSDEESKFDFVKSISISASETRFLPGIYLARRLMSLPETSLILYQESKIKVWDTYSLIKEQPWQYRQKKAIVSFNPLNAHLVADNKSLTIKDTPVVLSADAGIRYFVDEPLLVSNGLANDLPIAMPEGMLRSILNISAKISRAAWSYKQSFQLEKGWLAAHSYINQPYLPLFSAESRFDYKYRKFTFSASLDQSYRTQDERGNCLREAINPGAGVDYSINSDMTIYGKLSNLLNKGKYAYKTLPTEPASIMLGCLFVF